MRKILLNTDIIVHTCRDNKDFIVLIKRKAPPAKGLYAFPGGLVRPNERIEESARRELVMDTGLSLSRLKFFSFFESEDARGKVISGVFSARVQYKDIQLRAGNDAESVELFELNHLPRLAFDNSQILAAFKKKII